MSAADEKRAAGVKALDYVTEGTVIGLGTGSTAEEFVKALGAKVADGFQITGVPTSEKTAELATSLSIPLTTLEKAGHLALTVDGADEADPQMRLIKGGGGALLREKIVAAASDAMVVIVDSGKQVGTLGAFPLPVEIVPFGAGVTADKIKAGIAAFGPGGEIDVTWRKAADGSLFLTDGGHYIVDCAFGRIDDVEGLAGFLSTLPGVVDHGLFIGLASALIVGRGTETEVIGA